MTYLEAVAIIVLVGAGVPRAFLLAAPPSAGTYLLRGGLGTLTIKSPTASSFGFSIDTSNYLDNVCEMTGQATIRGLSASFKSQSSPPDDCKIDFTFGAQSITVSADCDAYCGKGADMDGEFRVPPPECVEKRRHEARAEALSLSEAKKHREAGKRVEELLSRCDFFLGKLERAWLKSDLALFAYRAGDRRKCLSLLASTEVKETAETFLGIHDKERVRLQKEVRSRRALCDKPAR